MSTEPADKRQEVGVTDYSYTSLLKFLDYMADKGLGNKSTIASRKGAVSKVLGTLDEAEREDLRELDLDDAFSRFVNLHGTNYRPESIQVYRSRIGTSLEDFFAYKENPGSFRPAGKLPKVGGAQSRKKRQDRPHPEASETSVANLPALRHNRPEDARVYDLPIPIRPGAFVTLMRLPEDLTRAEASRIARIVEALAPSENLD